jgi:C1A family cysteine protease
MGANAFCKVTSGSKSNHGGRTASPSSKSPPLAAKFSKYIKVATRDEKALMEAVHLHGPVAVSLDASLDTFKWYSEGVYKEAACMTKEDDLDHAVLLVGYGTAPGGEDYWLIRNSWSKLWGEDGYIKISREYDCGITTAAGFVVVNATAAA